MKKLLYSIACLLILFACSEDEPPMVTSIMLDVNKLELKIGESYQFKVTHNPPEAKAPAYKWEVSKYYPMTGSLTAREVATIEDGKITAIKEGTTTVTVETVDLVDPATSSPFRQTCEVVIKPVEAEGIRIDKTEITLDAGKTETLTCTLLPENTTNKKVYWRSSDNKVVAVSKSGANDMQATLTAIGVGEATVTVYVGSNSSVSAECKVKVNPVKLEGLSLSETEKTVIQGEPFTLTPVFSPENATNKNITWSSSDESIAQVDQKGVITTVSSGECLIKAISEEGNFEAQCKLTVKPVPVQGIKFAVPSYQVEIGGEKQLEVIFTPTNAGNKNLEWSSSNPIAVSIDKNGKVKGNASGYATIVAMSEDGGFTAECQVSVVEIDKLMDIRFPSSALTIIDGYYIGQIYCSIRNNSSHTVKLTKFSIIETSGFTTVTETTDQSLLGELAPGKIVSLGGRFNFVYEPAFCWEFEYNGKTYTTYTKYGDSSFLSEPVIPVGKSARMIELNRQ